MDIERGIRFRFVDEIYAKLPSECYESTLSRTASMSSVCHVHWMRDSQQRQKEVKQDLIDTIKASRRAVDANKAGLVWCTECATQLRKDERIIKAHFLSAHQIDPSHSLIKAVLNNRQCINGEILTGIVRPLPTDGISDYDQIHSGKLFGEVQGGGVETNRRK